MRKWVRLNEDNIVVASYRVDTDQKIDKEVFTDLSLQEMIGRIYVDSYTLKENTVKVAYDWRDEELRNTDWVVAATDHPQHAAYLTYRQALRDWPSTEDFPDVKPTLSS